MRTLLALAVALVLLLAAAPAGAVEPLSPVGILTTPNGRMALHAEPGHCVRGARLVVWTDAGGDVHGCWAPMVVAGEQLVSIALGDGDTYRLPLSAFLPAVQRLQRAPGTTL